MKRIVIPAVLVLCVLLLPVKEKTLADQAVQINLAGLQWHLLQPTATKTDLGGDLPEVAILTLSNDDFMKINGNRDVAMKYLIDQGIFKKKLLNVVFCGVTPSNDGSGQWILIIPHTYQSTAYIVAWQVPQKYAK